LALVHVRAGESALALPILDGTLAILERNLGADSGQVGFVWGAIAEAHLLAGDARRALDPARRALRIIEARFGAGSHLARDAALDVGWALVGVGQPREALAYLARAVTCDGCDADTRALSRGAMARALAASGGDRARVAALVAEGRAELPAQFPAYGAAFERLVAGL
jgi:hypothetical protein